MLETSLVALQDISLDKIFDEPGQKALYAEFGKLMEQVYLLCDKSYLVIVVLKFVFNPL